MRSNKFFVHVHYIIVSAISTSLALVILVKAFTSQGKKEKHFFDADLVRDMALARSGGPPYEISVCCVVQQEAPYVAEWIVYHRLIGVDHFYIYDNNSTDDLESTLKPFIDLGWVTLQSLHSLSPGENVVREVADLCNKEPKSLSKWLAMFEVDEFIVLVGGGEMTTRILPQLLKKYENRGCAGLLMDRLNFGSGSYIMPPKGLVIENYVERKVADELRPASKTIAFTERTAMISHHFLVVEDNQWDICLSNLLTWSGDEDRAMVLEPIRLHHYLTRSWKECMEKLDRRKNDSPNDWRAIHGRQHCDKYLRQSNSYNGRTHTNDSLLSSSIWPHLVRSILLRF